LNRETSRPASSTTPARSMPRIAGSGWRACAAAPAWILVSSGLTALARTRTSTSCGPISGVEMVERRKGALWVSRTFARIVDCLVMIVLLRDRLNMPMKFCMRRNKVVQSSYISVWQES
jgi:hypothetical protein